MRADLQKVGAARHLPRRAVERDSQPTVLPSRGLFVDRIASTLGGPGEASDPRDQLPRMCLDFFIAFHMLPRSFIEYKGSGTLL
jgi:hypothetical protein